MDQHDNLYEDAAPDEVDAFADAPESAVTGIAILAERVEQLVQFCERLLRENRELREQALALQLERDALQEKHEQSRARIEAMIVRLRDMEQAS